MVDDSVLFDLSSGYARAIDRRDSARLIEVFSEDAELVAPPARPGEAARTYRGHRELTTLTETVAGFQATYHMLGTRQFSSGPEAGVNGEVYCIAHHLRVKDDGATDFVMYLRYLDHYEEVSAGRWAIARREIALDWTESLPVRAGSWA
jgi:ketosteroid isomerase-like protein